jgi:hypothetical protein
LKPIGNAAAEPIIEWLEENLASILGHILVDRVDSKKIYDVVCPANCRKSLVYASVTTTTREAVLSHGVGADEYGSRNVANLKLSVSSELVYTCCCRDGLVNQSRSKSEQSEESVHSGMISKEGFSDEAWFNLSVQDITRTAVFSAECKNPCNVVSAENTTVTTFWKAGLPRRSGHVTEVYP